MSIELVVEVFDRAPKDCTPAEVLALLTIAERASTTTREAYGTRDEPFPDLLRRRMRMTEAGVRRVLQRLADRGLEVRVPIVGDDGAPVRDARGRPLFACNGRQTTYRLPTFKGGTAVPPSTTDGETSVSPSSRDAGLAFAAKEGPQSAEGDTPVTSRRDGSTALPVDRVTDRPDARATADALRAARPGLVIDGQHADLIAKALASGWQQADLTGHVLRGWPAAPDNPGGLLTARLRDVGPPPPTTTPSAGGPRTVRCPVHLIDHLETHPCRGCRADDLADTTNRGEVA